MNIWKIILFGFIVGVVGFVVVKSVFATEHHYNPCPVFDQADSADSFTYSKPTWKNCPTPTEVTPSPTDEPSPSPSEEPTATPTPGENPGPEIITSDGRSSCPQCTQAPKVDNQSGQPLLPPSGASK